MGNLRKVVKHAGTRRLEYVVPLVQIQTYFNDLAGVRLTNYSVINKFHHAGNVFERIALAQGTEVR